jgi:two-component system, NtrC family, response regulator AtoC
MLQDKRQILVIDDEANFRRVLAGHLALDGYEVHEAESVAAGIAYLQEHYIDLVLTDLKMGDDSAAGMEVLQASLRDDPSRPVMMITGNATFSNAVEATKLGAFDYLAKPIDDRDLGVRVAKAMRTRALRSTKATSDSTLPPGRGGDVRFGILNRSAAMRAVLDTIERVADTSSNVLVTGETGTGKELVAQALHAHSRRRDKPFIAINCSAIPADLVESELFGHEKGAFTGAAAMRVGKFEIAHGGTLFLDEIGEMPPEMQAKLLRVLQERKVERVGSGQKVPIPVDVRVVAATHRDLKREMQSRAFREDLFYRLSVVPIALPPLRERREDIPVLCEHFIARFNGVLSRRIEGIEPAALERLADHAWPGNIRELENVIERAMLFADGPRIQLANLSLDIQRGAVPATPPGATPPDGLGGLKEQLRAVKQAEIEAALRQTGGNVSQAAKLLKSSRKALQNWMKEMKLR